MRPHPARWLVSVLFATCAAAAPSSDELLLHLDGESVPAGALAAKGLQVVAGRRGQALRFAPGSELRFASAGRLDRRRGTVCLWVKPNWIAAEKTSHALFSDDRPFRPHNNSMLLWEWHTGRMRFDVRDEQDRYLTSSVKAWKKGEWHHVAAAWDCEAGTWLFVDGRMVAHKTLTWEPKPSAAVQIGGKAGTSWQADADLDDVRIYARALTAAQVRRVMDGKPLQRVRYLSLTAPKQIVVGEPFEAKLAFDAGGKLDGDYHAALMLGDLTLATRPIPAGARSVALRAAVPAYLYPSPGKRTLTARVEGAFEVDGDKAQREITLLDARGAQPKAQPRGEGIGLLANGRFLTGDEAKRAAKTHPDAVWCRLIDEVDCTQTDHGYWENSPATVEELAPGLKFRCVGPQAKVTQTIRRRNREHKALAGFAYRLKCMPRPTPHLVVVESINDAERYLEVAIDHPSSASPAPHLAASGVGRREVINLGVTYTGREYRTDGQPFRQAFMIFPKANAVDVLITGTARGRYPDAKPAAVSHIWVYEMAARGGEFASPLADYENPLLLPKGQPQRTASIFFPAVQNIFEKYGFTAGSVESRASTLRLFVDYMRFMGLNRFEFRPFLLSQRALFKTDKFEHSENFDIFAEALPIMQEAGFQVVPRVMYLHSYHKLLEGDKDNFQLAADGRIQSFGREGRIPDPLRPPVQKIVFDSIEAFLDACKGYDNVPSVGFDTSIGGLYWNRRAPTSHTGYSKWDIEQFAKDTGTRLPDGLDTPKQRFDWLKATAWEPWIAWRCKSWHAFVMHIRDMARARGKTLELSVRIMPREEFWTEKVPIREIYRYTGYDPALFAGESGVYMDDFIRINSDRYFGRPWWKSWFYDPRQPALFRSQEPRHVELYFNYWELPFHPWGFRVGPGSPVGRNFFEPITYAMRTLNPHDVTFFNWFRASIGREREIREFTRAFRALPAVAPRGFDGQVEAKPMDERLWIKWFGDRLAVVNDAARPRDVTLRIPRKQAPSRNVFDAALYRAADARLEGDTLAVRLKLRPFDMRTLVFAPRGR